MTIDQEIQLAQQHLASGNVDQCESLCRLVLQKQPGHPRASYFLAQVELRRNRLDLAAEIYRGAIHANSGIPELRCELGVCLARMNLIDDAIAAWQQAIALRPGYAEVLDNLGSAHRLLGQLAKSAAFHERAIAAQPAFFQAHLNLGIALQSGGQHQLAIEAFQRAITLRPTDAAAIYASGVSSHALEQYGDAVAAYQKALAIDPGNALAKRYLANALLMNGEFDEAIRLLREILPRSDQPESVLTDLGAAYRRTLQLELAVDTFQRAAALAPKDGEIHSQLAESLRAAGRLPEAVQQIDRAVALDPVSQVVLVSLGVILGDTGQFDRAIDASRRAIDLSPQDAVAHFNLSTLLLRDDRYEEGFEEFEWRWKAHAHSLPTHGFRQPQWDGSDLNGRRILLYAEQGFGDTIQFARYASLVADRGGKVILACQPELQKLMTRCDGVQELYDNDPSSFDVHFPLLSLPRLFRTRLATIPAATPYLHAEPSIFARWRRRLSDHDGSSLKVGLVWSGRAYPPGRSVPLEALGSLASIRGVCYVSLQFGEGIEALGMGPSQVPVVNASPEITNFDALAGAMMGIDLLITIDTAAAHLAGALGIPVWTLLPHVADWRWRRSGDESRWYPTMRLFRQKRWNLWAEPLDAIARQLRVLASSKRP